MKRHFAILASVIALVACDASASSQSVIAVHIVRTPGLLVLASLDQTITDRGVAGKLADDIRSLPAAPKGAVLCPIDFGTTYTLTFTLVAAGSWSAVVSVLGCRDVKLNDGRTLSALNAPKLFTDLGSALGLPPDELVPRPCPAATPGAHCFDQPSPSSQ